MEQGLFGIIESKAESTARAQRISLLLSRIADAPEDRAGIRSMYETITHFIDLAQSKKLGPNDIDGLYRTVGDISEAATEQDYAAMHKKSPGLWKRFPVGWAGASHRHSYCCTLHPKEITYLEEIKETQVEDMKELRGRLNHYKRELRQLRSLGDLPKDIAARCHITPNGFRAKQGKLSL